MGYTLSGTASGSASGANPAITTVTLSVGPTPGAFIVVAIVAQNGVSNPSLTVGTGSPIPLNLDVVESGNVCSIFSGVATGLSGSQTLTLSMPSVGAEFSTNGFCLWYMEPTTTKQTTGSGNNVSSFNVSVNSGNYLFAVGARGSAFNFNSSTVAPFENTVITGAVSNGTTADWGTSQITSSNASFSVSAGAAFSGAAAAYQASAGSVPSAGIIGLASCDW